MDLGLDGKVALITGASGGIGAATARMLAEEGANIVVCFNQNRAGADRTAESVRDVGRLTWLCQMNVAEADDVDAAISNLADEARCLDVVVLCAGDAPVTQLEDLTSSEWKRIVDVNLNGAFNVLKAIKPLLSERASIVTVASVAAQTGVPHQAHYAAAKAGLINLTKSTARAFAPHIRVNCVAPGMTLTEMGKQTAANLPPDYAQKKLLVGRFAEPNEIARCIVFLASSAASFVTGATLDVSGGRHLR